MLYGIYEENGRNNWKCRWNKILSVSTQLVGILCSEIIAENMWLLVAGFL